MVLQKEDLLKNNMGNPKTTGQDYIDYYEKKKKETGKTTASENAKYYRTKKEQQAEIRRQMGY